ncbi:MAG: DUF3857 and transglutaminase domain-containing protein [Gemmatimonadota bacterium]
MRRRIFRAVAVLALAPASLRAQSPVVTPDGDPSVNADTIYRLTYDSIDYPENSTAVLLDDGIIRLEADGRATETFRTITQILKASAVENYSEYTFGWDADRDSFRVNWARVVRPDGTVVSEKPIHEQEFDVPVAEDAPVYTHRKQLRISLAGVAPGTLVDISTTRETLKPEHRGDYYTIWTINTVRPTRRSRFIVDLPAKVKPILMEKNLQIHRRDEVRHGRHVYTWYQADVARIVPEAFAAADSNQVIETVSLALPMTWDSVTEWYTGLSRDRYQLTPEIRKKEAEILQDARTRADTLKALYRWVAQDFRYVSLSLGEGGYVPRAPDEVFKTGAGDCKDKTTFFVAVARDAGYDADPVLVASGGSIDPALPSIQQFDHMIAAVARPDGGHDFLELTSSLAPYGAIMPSYQNGFALLIHRDGTGEVVRLPADSAGSSQLVTHLTGALDSTGAFHGTFTQTATGAEQYSLREAFEHPLSEENVKRVALAVANRLFTGAQGDSLSYTSGRDLAATPRVSLRVDGGPAARPMADGSMILELPIQTYDFSKLIARVEETASKRRFPIDIGDVVGPVTVRSDMCLALPAGWKAELPANVEAKSAFGSYAGVYSFEDGQLCVRRTIAGWRGVAPATDVGDLVDWLRAASRDNVSYLVLKRPQRGGSTP